jgi:CO dehydrogenase maturation factor
MKLAISGKGGTGKSTLTAALAQLMAEQGWRVLAVDADPDGSLASALGASPEVALKIIPIAQQKALIEERTGAKIKTYGQMFKLNPEVSDIADRYGITLNGVTLLTLGAIEAGGSGCACPESVLLKALVSDMVLRRKDAVIMDMEAGVEHLGRATARGVDTMLVLVEPSLRAVDSALRVSRLAADIGLHDVRFVANKIVTPEEERFVLDSLGVQELAGVIPFSDEIRMAERHYRSVLECAGPELRERFARVLNNLRPKKEKKGLS